MNNVKITIRATYPDGTYDQTGCTFRDDTHNDGGMVDYLKDILFNEIEPDDVVWDDE